MFMDIMDKLRTRNPKEFFTFANCVSGFKKKITFAQAFKSSLDSNGDIVEAPSFKDYMSRLYQENAVHNIMPFIPRNREEIVTVSTEDMELAFKQLKTGKAGGLDGLRDFILKAPEYRNILLQRLTPLFNDWANGGTVPAYLKATKTIPLSKEDNNNHPEEGNIRTIAVASALTKLYENVLLEKLQKHVDDNDIMFSGQRGFRRGMSTLNNIHELQEWVSQAKQEMRRNRNIISQKRRKPDFYVITADLVKSFDRVNRPILIEEMLRLKFNSNLVRAVRELLDGTEMNIKGEAVKTNIGTPQGSILSPLLHNIHINQVLINLNKLAKTLGYADDTIFFVKGEFNLNILLTEIKAQFKKIRVEVNTKKSSIMQLVTNMNQRNTNTGSIKEIPMVRETKYLGCMVNQTCNWNLECQAKRTLESNLKKATWVLRKKCLSSQ